MTRNDIAYCLGKTVQILDNAVSEYSSGDYGKPQVFIAYSGGKDSAVTMDVVKRWGNMRDIAVKAMAIDTGLSVDTWMRTICEHCVSLSLELQIARADGFSWYAKNVAEYGFGYTPSQHVIYYRMLKQRAIERHLKSVKRGWYDKVIYVTGVRRDESAKRATTKDCIQHGARITVNAIAHWPRHTRDAYLSSLCKWWSNDAYKHVGNSGDCQCNWTCNLSLEDIAQYPRLYNRISHCEASSLAAGLNAYGQRLDEIESITSEEEMPEDSLCINCYQERLL